MLELLDSKSFQQAQFQIFCRFRRQSKLVPRNQIQQCERETVTIKASTADTSLYFPLSKEVL
jgi:hypothetical protein